jgi:hypothetical protein
MKLWLTGITGAVFGGLLVAWLTGQWDPARVLPNSEFSEHYNSASRIARRFDFFALGDRNWSRPRSSGFQNNFQSQGDVVHNAATKLTWQKLGSSESMGFSKVDSYLRQLNNESWGGHTDWRLPSLTEAWTLLEPRKSTLAPYIDPLFGAKQRHIWTSTITESSNSHVGWKMDFGYGQPTFMSDLSHTHGFVRAVRGREFK